jgi:hypothetical protein
MYNTVAYAAIDFVQTGKRQMVEHLVKHPDMANVCNQFIDAQTAYTKNAVDASIRAMTDLSGLWYNPKFGTELAKSYGLDRLFNKK